MLRPAALALSVAACSTLASCDAIKAKTSTASADTVADAVAVADSGATTTASAPAAALAASNTPKPTGACAVVPPSGAPVPASARAIDIRIAAAGPKALVTWTEPYAGSMAAGGTTSVAHVFDSGTSTVGARVVVDASEFGDSPLSGAAPVVRGGELSAVSCFYGAPSGNYGCSTRAPAAGAKPVPLFAFGGISSGGPANPGLAAVTKGDDVLVFVPDGGAQGLFAFSSRISGKKKSYPFPMGGDDQQKADGISALPTGDDEAFVVYRFKGAVRGRKAGFDEAWKGKPVDLSSKGAVVGAPVATADGGTVTALFAQRAKTSDPWRVAMVEWSGAADVKRAELPTGALPAQGPGITKAEAPGCFLVSWVEGAGKATTTKAARACSGAIAPESVTTLSSAGVEGGRAYLASDRATPSNAFVVWQELPAGKPAELRVAKLACP
jgi:hypothetical protein